MRDYEVTIHVKVRAKTEKEAIAKVEESSLMSDFDSWSVDGATEYQYPGTD